MSAENEASQEPTTQVEGQQTEAPPPADSQQTEAVDQTATESEADKAAQEARERDEKGRFKGVQPRIDELTRARREAEREAAYWKAVASGKSEGSAPEAAAKPQREQFATEQEYEEARIEWAAERAAAKLLERHAQTKQQEVTQTTWQERQAAVRAQLPDYDQVVGASDVPIAAHVSGVIMKSEFGPALAYHFARNPDVLTRLNGMSPDMAALEMGVLAASLASKRQEAGAPPVKTTNAPKPASTTASQGRATVTTDPSRMSMDEYRKFRAGQGARWAR